MGSRDERPESRDKAGPSAELMGDSETGESASSLARESDSEAPAWLAQAPPCAPPFRVIHSASLRLAPSLHIRLTLGLCAIARVLVWFVVHSFFQSFSVSDFHHLLKVDMRDGSFFSFFTNQGGVQGREPSPVK